jgi:hypothetical protein
MVLEQNLGFSSFSMKFLADEGIDRKGFRLGPTE